MTMAARSFSGTPVHLAFQLSRSDVPPTSATPPVTTTVNDGEEAPFQQSDNSDPNGELSRWQYTSRRPSASTNPRASVKKPDSGPVWPS